MAWKSKPSGLVFILGLVLAFTGGSSGGGSCDHLELPTGLARKCQCENYYSLTCKGLNSTLAFSTSLERSMNDISVNTDKLAYSLGTITNLAITDSNLKCVDLGDLASFANLKQLAVKSAMLRSLWCHHHEASDGEAKKFLKGLHELDLTDNKLTSLTSQDLSGLPSLSALNISGNLLSSLSPDLFSGMSKLAKLDLSNNKLNRHLKPSVLTTLPSSVRYLDISNNSWACSADLAWLHKWKIGLRNPGVLKNAASTRCHHDEDARHTSRLFLVMKYYAEIVQPSCPVHDGCTCLLHSIQETIVTSAKRHYTVHVNCADKGLEHFPKLPKHTQTVDLSRNKLNNTAFSLLKVTDHNYDEVENLTLDGNKLESLPEKLLEMNLGLRFSAKTNELTSISYDVSQRLIQMTDVIELSNNPWVCTCSSQITDVNLIAKVADRSKMICGPGSDIELQNKRIDSLDPDVLCPPRSNGEAQELLLQLLCVVLAILIVVILSKLAYDFRAYRTRGQLPWLVLKMP